MNIRFGILAFFTIISVLLSSHLAQATLKLVTLRGYSNYDDQTTPTKPVIYGGMGGTCSSDAMDGTNTCDSCTSTVGVCNSTRIYTGLKLYFEIQTDNTAIITASSKILLKSDTTIISLESAQPTMAVNTALAGYITWGSLCNALGSASCASSLLKNLTIGIDKDGDDTFDERLDFQIAVSVPDATTPPTYHSNCESADATDYEGFCHFTVVPGDKKVYVKSPKAPTSTYPQTGTQGITYNKVRFYYIQGAENSAGVFGDLNPTSSYKDLSVTISGDDFFLTSNSIEGLENDTTYYFLMANVDVAGNVRYFSPTSYLNVAQHSATTGEVVGLLDDQKCFIATAAFGSPLTYEVKSLRNFRNIFLMSHPISKAFVDFYYKHSPKYAKLIAGSPYLKGMAQVFLWPLFGLAHLLVSLGIFGTVGVGLLLISLSYFFAKRFDLIRSASEVQHD